MVGSPKMSAFDSRVYAIVRRIPAGRVVTYGMIASMIPPPPQIDPLAYEKVRARWVGYAMARCPDRLPWHRVINAQGKISQRPEPNPSLQRHLLEEEGVKFDGHDCIDLRTFGWEPGSQPRQPGAKSDRHKPHG